MDGNRRWAKANNKTAIEGHQAGYRNLKKLIRSISDTDIDYISIYSFSSENWSRSKTEVDGLMKLLAWVIENELEELVKEGLKIRFIGSKDGLSKKIMKLMDTAERKSASNNKTICVCFNYGGQQEIADAAKAASKVGEITPDSIEQNLYAPEIPPCDLIIRTSGEQRLSNYMLWRAAYSELAFTDTLWPDFTPEELHELVESYNSRNRRFGG